MTLTIQDLGALGELLGSVAVLATLVYLALQTRQNTEAISVQLDAIRVGASRDLNLTVATSDALLEALNEDRGAPRTIGQARLDYFWRARFFMLQWNFFQVQGDEEEMARVAERVRAIFNEFRSVEAWWESTKPTLFSPHFIEWVEEQRAKAA